MSPGPGLATLGDALLARRLLERALRVGLGDLGLATRVVVVALVELVLRRSRCATRPSRARPARSAARRCRAPVAITASVAVVCERTVDPAHAPTTPISRSQRRRLHGVSFAGATAPLSLAGATGGPCSSGRFDGSLAATIASSRALSAGLRGEPAEPVGTLEVRVRGQLARLVEILGRARPPVGRVLVGLDLPRGLDRVGGMARDLVDVSDRAAGRRHDREREHPGPNHVTRAYHRDCTRRLSRPSSIAT